MIGTFMFVVVALVVQSVVSACLLWCGMKITKEDGDFRALIVAAFLASLFRFIPVAGGTQAILHELGGAHCTREL